MTIQFNGNVLSFLPLFLLAIMAVAALPVYFLAMKWIARILFKIRIKLLRALAIEIVVTLAFILFCLFCLVTAGYFFVSQPPPDFVNALFAGIMLVSFLFSGAFFYAKMILGADGRAIGRKRGILLSLATGVAKIPLLLLMSIEPYTFIAQLP